MPYYTDDDATPRPLRIMTSDEWVERSPYIPRRKSSNNEGPVQVAPMTNAIKVSSAQQDKTVSLNSHVQKARFPIDGYDPPFGQGLHQIPLQRGPELRRPHLALKQFSSRRFLERMFSNLPFPSNTSRPQTTQSNAANSKLGRTHRRIESQASSCASSTLSISTAPASSQENTVRRRRQLALTSIRSLSSNSSNPLRVPPPSLLGPTQDSSTVSLGTESICSTGGSSAKSTNVTTLAYGQLQYLTFAGNDQATNSSLGSVWVIMDIKCSRSCCADPEALEQERCTNKSSRNPGLLKDVTLFFSTLPNCQITTILGRCTAATLSLEQTFTAIVLVTLYKPLLSSMKLRSGEESGKPEASSSRRRPTSDVLNDELMSQLLGTAKRTSRSEEGKMEADVLKAAVTYEHSLLPPGHEISYEETVTVKRAMTCNSRQSSKQIRKQKQDRGSSHLSAAKKLSAQETQNAAEKIIRVLREGLHVDGNTTDAGPYTAVDARQAVKLLNDFLPAATALVPKTNKTLEMLMFRYSMLISNDDKAVATQSPLLPKRHHFFDRRKDEKRNSFESESPRYFSRTAETACGRRNAFEIDREAVNFEQGLTDITNRTGHPGHGLLAGSAHLLAYNETIDFAKYNGIPAPLFSPKRRPDLVPSSGTSSTGYGSLESFGERGYHGDRWRLQPSIGSASFYAAEVEQMTRQACDRAPTTCHHRSKILHESAGVRGDMNEEDGNDKAKLIWERMRISSEGSGTSAQTTEIKYSDQSAEEAEMVRDCKVLGAPWLA